MGGGAEPSGLCSLVIGVVVVVCLDTRALRPAGAERRGLVNQGELGD